MSRSGIRPEFHGIFQHFENNSNILKYYQMRFVYQNRQKSLIKEKLFKHTLR